MKKLKAGIVGMGYIGASHIEGLRRIGFAECSAITDVNYELAKMKAESLYIPKCYRTLEEMINDVDIDVIHNCTPNNLHFEINKKIIMADKHVFSEKPLAMTSDESRKMLKLLEQHPKVVHGVNYCYRMNPLVQETKHRIEKGELGRPLLVHGSYLQDWLLHDTDYNWRIEPEVSGPSRCISDIGTHWMDLVQCMLGAKIVEVCADLVTVYPVRKKPLEQVETFSVSSAGEYEVKKVVTEDYGAVMFKMDNGTSGVFHVSEVSAGHGCFLNFEINGTKCSVAWNQEQGDRMWVGHREKDNNLVMRNPANIDSEVLPYTHLAKGHPEGWNDTEAATIFSFYNFIREGKKQGVDKEDFANFNDGHYEVKLVEAILKSNKKRGWQKV
ncbi:MAG: Gfo/Idh/MocA family oxidoreductase [Clostridiales bacterium]|nr:Gfo/Idh/MocA family oxidoreductase [Clostridiales bacterium]